MAALGNILILMALIFSIFAIIGCYLFSDIVFLNYKNSFGDINEYYNTDNFYNSFLLTFRCASGESWPMLMLEYSKIDPSVLGPWVSIIYFIGLIFFCTVIMLNLFVLVVLQQYDEFHQKDHNPINSFQELLESMQKIWNKYSEDKGERINMALLSHFLMDMEGDLALDVGDVDKVKDEKLILKKIKIAVIDLKFLTDPKGYNYFQDVLYKLLKNKFGIYTDFKGQLIPLSDKINLIKKKEEKVQRGIFKKIKNFFVKNTGAKEYKNYKSFGNFNQLTTELYYNITSRYFKLFIRTYRQISEEQQS